MINESNDIEKGVIEEKRNNSLKKLFNQFKTSVRNSKLERKLSILEDKEIEIDSSKNGWTNYSLQH